MNFTFSFSYFKIQVKSKKLHNESFLPLDMIAQGKKKIKFTWNGFLKASTKA